MGVYFNGLFFLFILFRGPEFCAIGKIKLLSVATIDDSFHVVHSFLWHFLHHWSDVPKLEIKIRWRVGTHFSLCDYLSFLSYVDGVANGWSLWFCVWTLGDSFCAVNLFGTSYFDETLLHCLSKCFADHLLMCRSSFYCFFDSWKILFFFLENVVFHCHWILGIAYFGVDGWICEAVSA